MGRDQSDIIDCLTGTVHLLPRKEGSLGSHTSSLTATSIQTVRDLDLDGGLSTPRGRYLVRRDSGPKEEPTYPFCCKKINFLLVLHTFHRTSLEPYIHHEVLTDEECPDMGEGRFYLD